MGEGKSMGAHDFAPLQHIPSPLRGEGEGGGDMSKSCTTVCWGDLPDLHRHQRSHVPLCCYYTKISILAVQAGFEPVAVALTARRSTY